MHVRKLKAVLCAQIKSCIVCFTASFYLAARIVSEAIIDVCVVCRLSAITRSSATLSRTRSLRDTPIRRRRLGSGGDADV
jgi:hypothetical protein